MLSGNRNFEGRLCDCVRANYLASPPLVVAYAIAGTISIDFEKEPLGKNTSQHAFSIAVSTVSLNNSRYRPILISSLYITFLKRCSRTSGYIGCVKILVKQKLTQTCNQNFADNLLYGNGSHLIVPLT